MSRSEQTRPVHQRTLDAVSSINPVDISHGGLPSGASPTHPGSPMNVRPLHDRLIVQRLEEGEQTVGGIIVPDSAKEKPQRGKVFAIGQGKVRDDGSRQPPDVKDGDTILFGKYTGQDIKIDGTEYLILREDEVLAIIDSK